MKTVNEYHINKPGMTTRIREQDNGILFLDNREGPETLVFKSWWALLEIAKWINTISPSFEKEETKKYRLLGRDELIEPTDEFLDDDCQEWHNVRTAFVTRALIGKPYNPVFLVPLRRPMEKGVE